MYKFIALSSLPISALLFWSGFAQLSAAVMMVGGIAAFPMVYRKPIFSQVRN